ncbi:Ig-like domain-containing protein [Demequina subtropica]|uniref:Ig-like domain-containing protein n=1 Tax=Demequina subtropica TaxID=1638989 RepID=UPI0007811859|nr:Ig-like domain-containing protein [Demequina subtropica]
MTEPAVGRYSAARRARAWRIGGGAACVALAAGVVLGPDFDQREVESVDPGVWVLKGDGDHAQYGRVNTTLGELDTYKTVANPDQLVQHGSDLLVYSEHLTAVTTVDPGRATDIGEGATTEMPAGVAEVLHSGDFVAYLTEGGELWGGRVSTMPDSPPAQVQVPVGEDEEAFAATAVALRADGTLLAYAPSGTGERVARAWLDDPSRTPEVTEVSYGLTEPGTAMTFVGDGYALWEPPGEGQDKGELWFEDAAGPVAVGSEGAVLQRDGAEGSVVVADSEDLWRVEVDGSTATGLEVGSDESLGTPARPTLVDGVLTAAWVKEGTAGGLVWQAGGVEKPLEDAATLTTGVRPVIQSNGTRAVLNETASGYVWTLPDGDLVESTLAWDRSDNDDLPSEETKETTERVQQEEAPVAVADSFGVRAGRQVRLPVLLNDHDANDGDVLAVDPASIDGTLDPAFGTVALAEDGQALVVSVADTAPDDATFTYRITDGALSSQTAVVTLKVSPEGTNSPPLWCGDDPGCLALAPDPSASVPEGGSARIAVLDAWVDPDGDPVYLAAASVDEPGVSVVAASDGTLAVTNAQTDLEADSAVIQYEVADARGEVGRGSVPLALMAPASIATETLAVQIAAGTSRTVDLAGQIAGAIGPVSVKPGKAELKGVKVANAHGVVGLRIDVAESASLGSYEVAYTASDGGPEVDGVLRVDVVDPAKALISTVPLTAFVRAGEDVTIDVAGSAIDPLGRVLLVEEVEAAPLEYTGASEAGAVLQTTLGHSVVDLEAVRVWGARPDGSAGVLGTVAYTVKDGEREARGEITVVLIDTPVEAPVAVADAFTVRAGTQMDLTVLANDAGAPGTVVALTAGSVEIPAENGLAFTSGRVVRYLAPQTAVAPFELTYETYAVGSPSKTSTATVTITVVSQSDTNHPPTPNGVSSRVNVRQSVTIPVPTAGQDVDGDRVRLVSVATQPEHGTATLSADGKALVYTSTGDSAGQDGFDYQVTDGLGEPVVAHASVAISDSPLGATPITYTDYVQVQAGDGNKVVVEPTANDTDPFGGALTLTSIVPDVSEALDEYEELAGHLTTEPGSELVTFTAGDEPATYSYVYEARSESGSAKGRVVVKVVRDPIPDLPVVQDTALSFQNRADFVGGTDVLSGKATWATGDVNRLGTSVYAVYQAAGETTDAASVTATDRTLSGALPDRDLLVVFEVTGVDFADEPTVTYGFLKVPGAADYVPALDADAEPVQVDEGATAPFDLAAMVTTPPGADLFIVGAGTTGTRGEAACGRDPEKGDTWLTYAAGKGSPYTDNCVVSVRVALTDGRNVTGDIAVPIVVTPEDPVPTLEGSSETVALGDSVGLDLASLVTWSDGKDHDLALVLDPSPSDDVTYVRREDLVTFTVDASAAPESQVSLNLTAQGYEDARAVVAVIVGPAPTTLPKGDAVEATCSADTGNQCDVTVIGGPGEVNPLPTTALVLDAVSGATGADACTGVSFAKVPGSTTAIRMAWQDQAPGGDCVARFKVRDAQGRVSTDARDGTLTVHFRGRPAAPTALTQTAFADGSLTLKVTGSTVESVPAVTHFLIREGGNEVAQCEPAGGECTVTVGGLVNGDRHVYSVVAVNPVGESTKVTAAAAWSYAPPTSIAEGSIAWEPTGDGTVDVTVTVADASTSRVRLSWSHGEVYAPVNGKKAQFDGIVVGTNSPTTVSITPVNDGDVPDAAGDTNPSTTPVPMHGIGAPRLEVAKTADGGADGKATFTVTVSGGGTDAKLYYGWKTGGGECTPSLQASAGQAIAGVAVQGSVNEDNTVTFCAEARWKAEGKALGTAAPVSHTFFPKDVEAPVLSQYSWGVRCEGARCWTVAGGTVAGGTGSGGAAPTIVGDKPSGYSSYKLTYFVDGASTGSKDFPWGSIGPTTVITAQYCHTGGSKPICSEDSAPVTAAVLNGGAAEEFDFTLACAMEQTAPADDVAGTPAFFAAVLTPQTITSPSGTTVAWRSYTDTFGAATDGGDFADPGGPIAALLDVTFDPTVVGKGAQALTVTCTYPESTGTEEITP